MTPNQKAALKHLAATPQGVSYGALARHLGMNISVTSLGIINVITPLRQKGLVRTRYAVTSGGTDRLLITADGIQVVSELRKLEGASDG